MHGLLPPPPMIMTAPDARLNASGRRQVRTTRSWASAARTEEAAMRINQRMAVIGGAAAIVAAGAGVAVAGGHTDANEGPDVPITGDALQKASDAALAETGGGTVTGTEVSDEESYYEVEVTRADGSQVDVQLDEHFAVVGSKTDSE